MIEQQADSAERKNSGGERELLERLAFASLKEQRKTRQWGIFFKLFFAIYLLVLLLLSLSDRWGPTGLASRYSALIDLEGVIDSSSKASADNMISALRAAFESKATAGVILRANSPGGSPVQAGYINDEITRLREKYPDVPVYAVISDICASGCYYVVAAADKIYANKASIVGSIGVLMDGFGFVDAMQKLGIERRLLIAGENKALLDPFSPLNARHRRYFQEMLKEIHTQFIDQVKEGRGEVLTNNKELFSGLVWTGDKAKELGLVDELGSASYVAREVIGAEEIVDFTVKESLFNRFAERIGATMAKTLGTELMSRTPSLK